MRMPRALLLDVNAESRLSDALRAILEPHFQVQVVRQWRPFPQSHTSIFSRTFKDFVSCFDSLVIFLILPSETGADDRRILESIKNEVLQVPMIAVVETCAPQRAFDLFKFGISDFITWPFGDSDVLPRAWKFVRLSDHGEPAAPGPHPGFKRLIGDSPIFLAHLRRIPLIAKCDANVLIAGETGTGKELYARAIHYSSSRAGRPFMPVNCGAIPVDLVENELFGHERGAFTSASTLQTGLIEEANGGTLFLDEIDCLPVFAQVKLLRFLQEKEYRPLGSSKMRRADVRIIAASNLNLEEAVDNGKVRQDLFYRLNIISLILPPLRERREDIALLARHFLARYSSEADKEIADLSQEALQSLMVYSWPGNVRELEHVIERAVVLCESSILQPDDLILSSSANNVRQESLQQAKAREIARFERNYIQGLLSACKGNITRAAQVAQKNRRAFWQLIQKHQIDVDRFRSSAR